MSKSRGTVVIANERCKGCEPLHPGLPPGVLSMAEAVNRQGYRFPILTEGCTGCTACMLVCPDYVFEVWRFEMDESREAV